MKKKPAIFARDNDPDIKAVSAASKGIVKTNAMSSHRTTLGTLWFDLGMYRLPDDRGLLEVLVPIVTTERAEWIKRASALCHCSHSSSTIRGQKDTITVAVPSRDLQRLRVEK